MTAKYFSDRTISVPDVQVGVVLLTGINSNVFFYISAFVFINFIVLSLYLFFFFASVGFKLSMKTDENIREDISCQ